MAKEIEPGDNLVFHGSAVEGLQTLSTAAAGTGEGASIRGYGLYFSSVQGVAEHYQALVAVKRNVQGVKGQRYGTSDGEALEAAQRLLALSRLDRRQFEQYLDGAESFLGRIAQDIDTGVIQLRSGGATYTARIPAPEHFLDWDAAMGAQSEPVRRALARSKVGVVSEQTGTQVRIDDRWLARACFDEHGARMRMGDAPPTWTGGQFYQYLSDQLGSPAHASAYLAELGVAGNRYVGESSGVANYVVFADTQVRRVPSNKDGDEFVIVNGKARPRHNSKGQLIHPSEKGLRNFWRWFGDSRAVDERGRPLVVLHGTTQEFERFDPRRFEVEANVGAGIYTSNSAEDVAANYANPDGADLLQKVRTLADRRVEDDFEEEQTRPISTDEAQQLATDWARAQLSRHEGLTLPLYMRLRKPAVLGGSAPTRLRYYANAYASLPYERQPHGSLNRFLVNLRFLHINSKDRLDFRDFEASEQRILDAVGDDGYLSVDRIYEAIEPTSDYATGKQVASDLVSRALREMGFDGVIDQTVNDKFGSRSARRFGGVGVGMRIGMPGMTEFTTHYIAFEPNQVKSSIGNSGAFSARTDRLQFSRSLSPQRPRPLWRSALRERLATSSMEQASPHGWLEWLTGLRQRGVSDDEIEWSGIQAWLQRQEALASRSPEADLVRQGALLSPAQRKRIEQDPGRVRARLSRADLLAYLDANAIVVTETRLSGPQAPHADEADESAADKDGSGDHIQYGQWTLAGGGERTELLLQLPSGWREASGMAQRVRGLQAQLSQADLEYREGSVDAAKRGQLLQTIQALRNQLAKLTGDPEGQLRHHLEDRGRAGDFRSAHWDGRPNVLAHIRLSSRTCLSTPALTPAQRHSNEMRRAALEQAQQLKSRIDALGREIQSLHGAAWTVLLSEYEPLIAQGQITKEASISAILKRLPADYPQSHEKQRLMQQLRELAQTLPAEFAPKPVAVRTLVVEELQSDWSAWLRERHKPGQDDGPQALAAPFVGSTSKWLALALKRVAVMAVSEGYDAVVFINGEQQSDRYKLDRPAGEVAYWPGSALGVGDGTLIVMPQGQRVDEPGAAAFLTLDNIGPEGLAKHLGAQLAQRLLTQTPRDDVDGAYLVDAAGEHVRSHGMRAFYDEIVPQAMRGLLKRLKVTDAQLQPLGDLLGLGQQAPRGRADPTGEAGALDGLDARQLSFAVTPGLCQALADGVHLFSSDRQPLPSPLWPSPEPGPFAARFARERTTVEQVRRAIADRFGPRLLDRLERSGRVKLVASQEDLARAIGQADAARGAAATDAADLDGLVKGVYDSATRTAYLVADALNEHTASAVLLHEVGIHMASDGSLDALFVRAGDLVRMGGRSAEASAQEVRFFNRVRRRMAQAGCSSNEEAAAFVAQEYEVERAQAPRSVRRWARDLRAAVRAWLFVHGIAASVHDLSSADIAAIAAAKARHLARHPAPHIPPVREVSAPEPVRANARQGRGDTPRAPHEIARAHETGPGADEPEAIQPAWPAWRAAA